MQLLTSALLHFPSGDYTWALTLSRKTGESLHTNESNANSYWRRSYKNYSVKTHIQNTQRTKGETQKVVVLPNRKPHRHHPDSIPSLPLMLGNRETGTFIDSPLWTLRHHGITFIFFSTIVARKHTTLFSHGQFQFQARDPAVYNKVLLGGIYRPSINLICL